MSWDDVRHVGELRPHVGTPAGNCDRAPTGIVDFTVSGDVRPVVTGSSTSAAAAGDPIAVVGAGGSGQAVEYAS